MTLEYSRTGARRRAHVRAVLGPPGSLTRWLVFVGLLAVSSVVAAALVTWPYRIVIFLLAAVFAMAAFRARALLVGDEDEVRAAVRAATSREGRAVMPDEDERIDPGYWLSHSSRSFEGVPPPPSAESAEPSTSAADEVSVDLGVFGGTLLRDGVAVLVDGGTHGRAGHTLAVMPDGSARWERRLDSMGDQSACRGAGARVLEPADVGAWRTLADAAWLCEQQAEVSDADPQVPRYFWAIAMRRDSEVLVLSGPPAGDPFAPPPPAAADALAWMIRHVDEWCAEDRAGTGG